MRKRYTCHTLHIHTQFIFSPSPNSKCKKTLQGCMKTFETLLCQHIRTCNLKNLTLQGSELSRTCHERPNHSCMKPSETDQPSETDLNPTQHLSPPSETQTAQTETQLQSRAFLNLWNSRPDLRGRVFAINQNSVNRIKGSQNRAMGVIAGVADMAFLVPGSVVWIEWKLPKQTRPDGTTKPQGTQSDEQEEFQSRVQHFGMNYHIVRSEDEFLEIIRKYE